MVTLLPANVGPNTATMVHGLIGHCINHHYVVFVAGYTVLHMVFLLALSLYKCHQLWTVLHMARYILE